MKHTIKLLTLAAILTAVFGLTGCPGPVNTVDVWDDGVVTTEPTCTTEGVKTYTCSNGETRTETIPALGHDFGEWSNWTTTREVAYDHDGEKEHTHTCTRCGHSETVKVTVSRFVAGGYDGNDVPTENAETYRYQYNGENDYQIEVHVYPTIDDGINDINKEVLYFSFPASTEISEISLNSLIHMKSNYDTKTVSCLIVNKTEFEEDGETLFSLTDLDIGSPIELVAN